MRLDGVECRYFVRLCLYSLCVSLSLSLCLSLKSKETHSYIPRMIMMVQNYSRERVCNVSSIRCSSLSSISCPASQQQQQQQTARTPCPHQHAVMKNEKISRTPFLLFLLFKRKRYNKRRRRRR